MQLNPTSIIKIDDDALDKLVFEKFGFKKYNFVAVQECGNDSAHAFNVNGHLTEYDKKQLAKWEKGEFVHYSNRVILNALCFHGLIPAGEYLVKVCW